MICWEFPGWRVNRSRAACEKLRRAYPASDVRAGLGKPQDQGRQNRTSRQSLPLHQFASKKLPQLELRHLVEAKSSQLRAHVADLHLNWIHRPVGPVERV